MAAPLSAELDGVVRDLNPWWHAPHQVRPEPPRFRRRQVRALLERLRQPRALIQVVRGPRQVGKTTALLQIIQDLIREGVSPKDVLLLRFDLQILREAGGLRALMRWFEQEVRQRDLSDGAPAYVFLDEVHKLPAWNEELKHLGETVPLRVLITGSSSVLVAKGARESLAGRVFTTEFPPFLFREVLEAWTPELVPPDPPLRFLSMFESTEARLQFSKIQAFAEANSQQLDRAIERYYLRGGYPRLHSGEVGDDIWADYLVETVFDRVLGVDIPELFPIEQPTLLRHLYLSVARRTGQEVSQAELAEEANAASFRTNQPTVGRYLHYLADALLVRQFRRYPLAKSGSSRVPVKMTLTDLGVRNAIFRGAPSLWDSEPSVVGPLVETVVQTVMRDSNLSVHFYRDRLDPKDRRSPFEEVDFVAERPDGMTVPVEVKFRRRIGREDVVATERFVARFGSPMGVLVTRDTYRDGPIPLIPLCVFLLSF